MRRANRIRSSSETLSNTPMGAPYRRRIRLASTATESFTESPSFAEWTKRRKHIILAILDRFSNVSFRLDAALPLSGERSPSLVHLPLFRTRKVGGQGEAGDLRPEAGSVGTFECIMALHIPGRRLEYAVTLILVGSPGTQHRLLPHDTLPVYLRVIPSRIVDPPMAKKEPGRFFPLVLHLHVVGEHESPLVERGVGQRESWPNPNEDAVSEFLVNQSSFFHSEDIGLLRAPDRPRSLEGFC